ncbi:MAG: cupin domain-containing protein [Alphaproteobacteria bacterium]|nr:cupin domain-containing protein [Alphaproteobacteria bacterium]
MFSNRTRGLPVAGLFAGAMIVASAAAFAGSCPADKMGVDVTKPSTMAAKDVTDNVLGMIDLSKEKIGVDRKFRLRKLVVQPGGVVPWHSHGDRPALIYIVSGEIIEYASNCAVPIVHKAGDVAPETKATSHWWKNTGKEPVVLLSADLLMDDKDHMM